MFSPDGTLISASAAPHCGSRQTDRKKRSEDNIREWTGLEFTMSQRAVENRVKWRKLVVKSFVVPNEPDGYWIGEGEGTNTFSPVFFLCASHLSICCSRYYLYPLGLDFFFPPPLPRHIQDRVARMTTLVHCIVPWCVLHPTVSISIS